MSKEEIRRQRIIAKAELDRLLHLKALGEATQEQINAQLVIVDQFRLEFTNGFTVQLPVTDTADTQRGLNEPAPPNKKAKDTDPVILEIKAEMLAIENEKNQLGNQLAEMPTDSIQTELVGQIKGLRDQYVEKSDELYYYLNHGVRYQHDTADKPEEWDEAGFEAELPRSKYLLYKKLKNRRCDLSKYKKRLSESKTEVKRANQLKNISRAEIEINAMEQLLSTISE